MLSNQVSSDRVCVMISHCPILFINSHKHTESHHQTPVKVEKKPRVYISFIKFIIIKNGGVPVNIVTLNYIFNITASLSFLFFLFVQHRIAVTTELIWWDFKRIKIVNYTSLERRPWVALFHFNGSQLDFLALSSSLTATLYNDKRLFFCIVFIDNLIILI